jgi:hypothetical protein
MREVFILRQKIQGREIVFEKFVQQSFENTEAKEII